MPKDDLLCKPLRKWRSVIVTDLCKNLNRFLQRRSVHRIDLNWCCREHVRLPSHVYGFVVEKCHNVASGVIQGSDNKRRPMSTILLREKYSHNNLAKEISILQSMSKARLKPRQRR